MNEKHYKDCFNVQILEITNKIPHYVKLDSYQLINKDIIIFWDSEYRDKLWNITNINERDYDEHHLTELISQQYLVWSNVTQKFLKVIFWFYDKEQRTFAQRIDLSTILSKLCDLVEIPWKRVKDKLKILLVSHYSKAELSTLTFEDYENLSAKLSEVQQALVSFKDFEWKINPFERYKDHKNEGYKSEICLISWRDTYALAPNKYKSLENLSTFTQNKKVRIDKLYYKDLTKLLHENEKLFIEYAIMDVETLAEFFTFYMNFANNNKLTEDEYKKIPITLANMVRSFFKIVTNRQKLENVTLFEQIFGVEKKLVERQQKNKFKRFSYEKNINFKTDFSISALSFRGGKNNISERIINRNGRENDEVYIDIDFDSGYTRALSLLPIINWNSYQYNSKENINIETIDELVKEYKQINNFMRIGFAMISFEHKDKLEGFLSYKSYFGLIYPQKGEVVVTITEMIESYIKGHIKVSDIKRLVVYNNYLQNNNVILAFRDFVKINKEYRNETKKGSLENALFKDINNSLYGCLAYDITQKTEKDLKGNNKTKKESLFTNPFYASTCTAIIRNALTDIIRTCQIFDQENIRVIHWTTDGCVISVNKKLLENVKKDIHGYPIFETVNGKIVENQVKFKRILPQLYNKIVTNPSIQYLIMGGKNLQVENELITIKTFGDQICSIDTRMNCLDWNGYEQSLARGNLPTAILQNTNILRKYALDPQINEIDVKSMVSIREMIKNKWHLVIKVNLNKKLLKESGIKKCEEHKLKIHMAFGFKNKLLKDGKTENFKDLNEAIQHRKIREKMVRYDVVKFNYDNFQLYLDISNNIQTKRTTQHRINGSTPNTIIRFITSILLQNEFIDEKKFNYKDIANTLNQTFQEYQLNITRENIKNWKRRQILVGQFTLTDTINIILNKILSSLKVSEDKKNDVNNLIF